jgi:hypothetical protein
MRGKSLMIVMIALVGMALILPAGQAQAHGGWLWGPAAFAGGLLLGATIARPWYYYEPAPVYVYPPPAYYAPQPVYYVPNQAYAYPDPAVAPAPAKGQWVEVPGQSINGIWVPPHKAWAPDNPR